MALVTDPEKLALLKSLKLEDYDKEDDAGEQCHALKRRDESVQHSVDE